MSEGIDDKEYRTRIAWCDERFRDLKELAVDCICKVNKFDEKFSTQTTNQTRISKLDSEIYGNGKSGMKSDLNFLMERERRHNKIQVLLFTGFILQLVAMIIAISINYLFKFGT